MAFLRDKKQRRVFIICMIVAVLVIGIAAAVLIYENDYYRADSAAISAFEPTEGASIRRYPDGVTAFVPNNPTMGFIFYPGGKVECAAYEPLMLELASKGFLCISVEMPLKLAVLNVNAADGILEKFPEIKTWYIGGHSLGGSMAAAYVANHSADYEGLVLLGAYSTTDLTETDLSVLSVYGSEDRVMNMEKYISCIKNMPDDFQQSVIEGACHAGFGMYGAQEGDGIPLLTNEEQIILTADLIAQFAKIEAVYEG